MVLLRRLFFYFLAARFCHLILLAFGILRVNDFRFAVKGLFQKK